LGGSGLLRHGEDVLAGELADEVREALPFSAATANDRFLFAGSKLYATRDAGRTWTAVETVAPPAPRVWDVAFTSPTDGGRPWIALAPRSP
jgi:photosystem II stability/assembly factor-like uncharacterized protein